MSTSCQEEEVGVDSANVATIVSIASENLPEASIAFIEESFAGEVVTSAYSITQIETNYEAYLTNDTNLVFDGQGELIGFGPDESLVTCGGELRNQGKPGFGRGPRRPRPPHGFGDSLNFTPPVEVLLEDVPTTALEYLSTNYPDSEIALALQFEKDAIEYHIHIEGVGALIFDAEGNFKELRQPPVTRCNDFEEQALEDIPSAASDYLSANYPEADVVGARTGTRNGSIEIHVIVAEVGVLIFDEDGNYIELKTCGLAD